jgi:hypothetical protein
MESIPVDMTEKDVGHHLPFPPSTDKTLLLNELFLL